MHCWWECKLIQTLWKTVWRFFKKKQGIKLSCVCVLSCFSCVRIFAALWTVAHQAPLSMGFSRQEYWRGLPCPPPGDLPNPGIEPTSPALLGGFYITSTTWEAPICVHIHTYIYIYIYEIYRYIYEIHIYEIYYPGRFSQDVSLLKGTYTMSTSLEWSKISNSDFKKFS